LKRSGIINYRAEAAKHVVSADQNSRMGSRKLFHNWLHATGLIDISNNHDTVRAEPVEAPMG
jgi:hypothetical protein